MRKQLKKFNKIEKYLSKSSNEIQQVVEFLFTKKEGHVRAISLSHLKNRKWHLLLNMSTTIKQENKIGKAETNYKKKSFCVSTLKDAYNLMKLNSMTAQDYQVNEEFVPLKIKFFFKKLLEFNDMSKDISEEFLLNHACSITFKKCSAQLIRSYFSQAEFSKVRYVGIDDCPISDSNLEQIVSLLDSQQANGIVNDQHPVDPKIKGIKPTNSSSFVNVEIALKKCSYLSTSALDCLKEWNNNSFAEPENKTQGNGLSLVGASFLRSTTLVQFAVSQYYKQLRKLKIKSHPVQKNAGSILNQILQFRNFTKKSKAVLIKDQKKREKIENMDVDDNSDVSHDEIDDDIQSEAFQSEDEPQSDIISNLERLSFDFSVCSSFDDLPLNSDYYSKIKSLSYNGTNQPTKTRHDGEKKDEKNKVQVTFNNMYPYSLNQLRVLKLKSCDIGAKCLSNLKYMDCLANIQVLNFKGSTLDLKEFKHLIINNRLTHLKYLNVSNTNIEDSFCTTISDRQVVSFDLEEIDISKTKVTLKGIKYLTFINTLRCINMTQMDQINCQISTFIIDLLETKKQPSEATTSPIDKFNKIYEEQKQENEDGEVNKNNEDAEEDKDEANSEKDKINLDNQQVKVEVIVNQKYEELQRISKLAPSIVHLDLYKCKNVTSALIEELFKHRLLNRLTFIDVNQTKVCNKFIDILKKSMMHQELGIREYWVTHTRKEYDKNDERCILEVCDNEFLHENLRHLNFKTCRQIRGFKIREFFKQIKLPNLEIIDVSNTNLFDDSLDRFFKYSETNLPSLTKIKMNTIKASSSSFQNMRKMKGKQIIYIDIQNTNFDDEASVRFFSDENNKLLSTLQYISIKDCSQLTTRGLESMIDGLAGISFTEIVAKRFKVTDEQRKHIEEKEKQRKKKELEDEKKRQEEAKILEKQQQREMKRRKSTKVSDSHPSKIIQPKDEKKKEGNAFLNFFKSDHKESRDICENFDVFQLLSDCSQLVTDSVFTLFLTSLQHIVKNIFEMNLNKMGRLDMTDFNFDSLEKDTFKNLEIVNINETRITTEFVKKFLQFWIDANQEKKSILQKSDDLKMKNFVVIKCAKAHFVESSILEVFKKAPNFKKILSKTQFKIEFLLNEIGQKIQDQNLSFMKDLRNAEFRNVSTNIKELNLENNQFLSIQGFQQLLTSNWMKFIVKLNLRNTQFGDAQLEFMTTLMKDRRNTLFSKLQYIGMRGCLYISKQGLHLLCQMEKLNEDFDLGCICEQKMLIDEDLMKAMAQSIYMCNTEMLDLSENGFKNIDTGFKYLCFKGRDKRLKLRTLNVSSTWISDKALQSLAVTENFCNLERIILTDCKRVTERGLSYLVDSRLLYNLDLFYLFNQNASLVSGRVIDTLKYSDRKKSIKEISLQGSLSQDKEMNNIMQEVVSKSLLIKSIDIRKTSHIGIQGLSYVYSMLQWNIVKNANIDCMLEVLLIDNNRYQEFKVKYSYADLIEKITSQKDQFQVSPKVVEEFKLSDFPKRIFLSDIPYFPKQLTMEQFNQSTNAIKEQFQHKILTSNRPTKLGEVFSGSFVQDLFMSAGNLKNFRYDYFIRKFALNIDDKFIDSLSLCDQRWSIQEEIDGKNEQKQQNLNENIMLKNLKKGNNKKDIEANDDVQQNEDQFLFPTFEKQFEYFDISFNKILLDETLCRFFLSTKIILNLKLINISFTLLSEQVILAICATPYLRENLEIVYFDKCPKLSVKKSLQYLLLTEFKNFKYQTLISQYSFDIDDEVLAIILYRFTDQELEYLNLSKSKITSQGLILLEKSPRSKNYVCLDLAFTGIEVDQFDEFMISTKIPFPPNLKYIWIENTYNLTDKKFSELQFWTKFESNKFDFMEMLQSKSRRLSLSLNHLANQQLRKYIFKKSYIQLDIFPQIQSDVLITLINECFAKEYNQYPELRYIYLNFRKQHYQALKQAFNWDANQIDIKAVCEKFCFRISSIPQEYQGIPILKLIYQNLDSDQEKVRDSIQFESHQYLTAMSYEHIMKIDKLVKFQTLVKLDLENTDISGNLFFQLCNNIVGNLNFITDLSLKGIQSIRDEHIINMMFDMNIDEIISSFQQINDHFRSNKLSEKQQNKQEKKKEIQNKIRDFSKKKKFPFLVELNIENTKVTQYSLCQILKTIPFNMNFRIEKLFSQYSNSKYCKLDDHVINELSSSLYLQNFKVLNLEKIPCTSAALNKIFKSRRSVNIRAIYLNTTNISEDAFITLSNSTNLPKLNQIKILEDDKILCKSYHYFLRAQYLSMNLKIDDLMKKQDVVDTSQFIQAIINSFYMNNITYIEIHSCNLFMNQIKSLFKLSKFTGFINKIILDDVKDSEDYKDVWLTIAQSKCFPRLQFLNIKCLEVREKFKPLFDIESLLKDNKKLINDQVIVEISQLPLLLNSKDIDLSDLSKIRPKAWEAFANSKYVGNLKNINFSYCTLMNDKTETEQDIIEYYRNESQFSKEKTKCQSLFQKNNFFNLDKIQIQNNKGLHISEIEYILQAVKKRHVSVRFNFEDVFGQLVDQIKPFLIEYASQQKIQEDEEEEEEMNEEEKQILAQYGVEADKNQSIFKQELIYYLWDTYIPELHNLFDKFFLKTREWYNIRHNTLDLTYYQFLIRFQNFQNVFRQIQDLSCIQNLKFYNFGFDSVFSSTGMKFLNLKSVKVLDLFNEKGLISDKHGTHLKKIIDQLYIKPYYLNINQFMENYKINNRIQKLFLDSTYLDLQTEFKIYLKFIEKDQIEALFKKQTHYAATSITIKDSYPGDPDIDKQDISQKQELFLTRLADSKNFSNIKRIEVVGSIDLKCLKLLIKSKIFHSAYDIQKLIGQTEVDQEYFDILSTSRYFSNLTYLLIPKFAETIAPSNPTPQKGFINNQATTAAASAANANQKGQKFKLNLEKINLNKITKLSNIKVIENIEDPDFLLTLFNFDNVRFNNNFNQVDKIDIKRLESIHFIKLFSVPMFGYDWGIIFQLLEKNLLSQDSKIYEHILLNQSTCFFFNQLVIRDSTSKEVSLEIVQTICKTMETIQQFMPVLQINKLVINTFPENTAPMIQLFKFISNLKEIDIHISIKFGIEELKSLLFLIKNTNVAETILNWVIPFMDKTELIELKDAIKDDKEIPDNVSFIDFSGNKNFLSKSALEQKILDLRTSKKSKNKDDLDDESQNDEEHMQANEEEEKDNENENEVKKEVHEEIEGGGDDGDEEEKEDEEKGEDKPNALNEKQDLDNKQLIALIQNLQKTSITEDDLFDFLNAFRGVREIDFKKTNADIYHLVKVKKLEKSNLLHFVNFEDCFELKNSVVFAIILQGEIKPWFQLDKYLDHLPLSKAKYQQEFLKALFNLEFFKLYFKYINFEFIFKINSTSNTALLPIFERIIKKRITNLDITAFMQNLPPYMKSAVTDTHIEKICKEYGCVQYLQPEKYPNVQYGFNHILQQKNIPTSIRLMYLLNEAFQKKISASSLSLVYQLAIESDQLKQKNIVKENDEQLQKFLTLMKKKAMRRKRNLEKKKLSTENKIKNLKDKKYVKVLNAVGRKKIVKDKKQPNQFQQQTLNKFATSKISTFKTLKVASTGMKSPGADSNQILTKVNNNPFDDEDEVQDKNEDDFVFDEKALLDQEKREQEIELFEPLNNEEKDDQEENLNVEGEEGQEEDDEDEDEQIDGEREEQEKEHEEQEGERELDSKQLAEDDEGQEEREGEEDQQEDEEINDQQDIAENEKEIEDQNFESDNFGVGGDDNADENVSLKDNVLSTMKSQQKKQQSQMAITQNGNDVVEEQNPQSQKPKQKKMDQIAQKINISNLISKKVLTKKDKVKSIKHNFEGTIEFSKPSLKPNTLRVYQNQVALRLHKELVNLHMLSESLKNQDKRVKYLAKKLDEVDDQIDIIDFELQLIELNQRDNNYEIANLFSFIEVLNLGENSHLNIYGLNYYISQHIQPWIKLNQNIGELKEGKNRSEKIKNVFENKEEEGDIDGIINPDHVLDDKLFEHLSYLIEERLKQLREINLRGLNVSDDFAEKFSLLLGDDNKLQHLNLLDLSQNRRLSPFGLKFLFSSIVNRIPEGFKIVISATNNDADHIQMQIQLLEKSIMKEAVWTVEKQQKEIAKYIIKNKKRLNKPFDAKVIPFEKSVSLDDLDSAENHNNNNVPKKLNLEFFDPHMPKLSDDEEDENKDKDSENNGDKNKNQIDEGKIELEKLDYISNVSEEQKAKKLQRGDLTFLFMDEQSLDSRIVKKLEKDKQFKDKIARLRSLQLAYKKAIQESGQNQLAQQIDARMIIQNIVNLGLYDAINITVKDSWKKNKFIIIFISLLFFPLTMFHLIMLMTQRLSFFFKKNSITLRFGNDKQKASAIFVELDKLIPDNIENTDFYFDEDVAQIDILLSRNKTKKVATEIYRRNGRLISKYVQNPLKYDFNKIYQEINTTKAKESHFLKYTDLILLYQIIIFILGICVAYPYYLIQYYLPTHQPALACGVYPILYDIPFFFFAFITIGFEAANLIDIQNIIVSKKIFNIASVSVILQLYTSFMLRYNVYSNMMFAHTIYYCQRAQDLGLISLIFLHIQISWTIVPALYRLILIMVNRRRSKKIAFHNTSFINQFTQLTQMLDFIGLSFVLDRFSTSSTVTLSGFYIPNFMNNVKIPQILLTKFQKLFYLDFPMISILLVYNLRKHTTTNLLSFENIRVILTTLLSVYSSLSQAWQAHPSVFRTYQMQDYLKFRQDTPSIYKIKIGTTDKFEHLKIQDVISKAFTFNQRNTLKIETPEDRKAKQQKEKQKKERQQKREKDGAASSKAASSNAGSVVSDNKSQAQLSQKQIGSQTSIQSRQSQTQLQTNFASVDKRKVLNAENFQQLLIEFILTNEKLQLDDEEEKQE